MYVLLLRKDLKIQPVYGSSLKDTMRNFSDHVLEKKFPQFFSCFAASVGVHANIHGAQVTVILATPLSGELHAWNAQGMKIPENQKLCCSKCN